MDPVLLICKAAAQDETSRKPYVTARAELLNLCDMDILTVSDGNADPEQDHWTPWY